MKQLNPHPNQDFFCDSCQKEFRDQTAYSPTMSGYLEKTYCLNCVETKKEVETCSFSGIDDKTQKYLLCNQPLFDKKKQLCRSHNRQVRKRFNEFTKEMSIGNTAAWEMSWEQSSDWKYFWDLAEETNKKKDSSTNEPLNNEKELKSVPPETKRQKNWGAAPINKTTENIQSLNLDKRSLKKTGRIHLFATRVKKEWIEQLKGIAYEERKHYNEVLEKALECYEKHRR